MSYILRVSKWEGSPLGKEILIYFWHAWFFGGVVRHHSVSCVKMTSRKSVLPNAASHTKGKRKNHAEDHFWVFRAKQRLSADLSSEGMRNALRGLIFYFDMSKPRIARGRARGRRPSARRELGAAGSSAGRRCCHLRGRVGMRGHGCKPTGGHRVGRGR